MGDKQDVKFFSHYYLHGPDTLDKSLAALGFHRDDNTAVLLTHLHFDHCGGSIVREGNRLVPAFKNATYWSNERHWKWATEPNEREKASFLKEKILPIWESGQLRFIDIGSVETGGPGAGQQGDEKSVSPIQSIPSGILPQLSLRLVNGHTDAMMLPQIRYKGRTIVFMADLLPSIGHIPLPYVMAYDMFPLTTLHEKKSFFSEAAAGNYVLVLEHDPVNECCVLQATEKGVKSGGVFKLGEV